MQLQSSLQQAKATVLKPTCKSCRAQNVCGVKRTAEDLGACRIHQTQFVQYQQGTHARKVWHTDSATHKQAVQKEIWRQDEKLYLRSQATVLQVPSEHKYSPVSHGSMILMVRVTLAFKLEME